VSDHGDLVGSYDTLRLHPEHGTEAQQRAALRAVLLRVDQGADTAADALLFLQALGLADTPPARRCPELSTRQRRQAARRAERAINDDRKAQA
jgi:hypothetical protein